MVLEIAIIGGGVNGLACGVKISEYFKEKANVTIISEYFTPNTTGDISAGLWGPYLMGNTKSEKIYKWSKEVHDFLEKIWLSEDANEAGVCLIPAIRVTTSTKIDEFWKDIVYGFRHLSIDELNKLNNDSGKKFVDGIQFITYTSEPIKLLPYFTKMFLKNGGNFKQEKVENLKQFVLQSKYDLVINCCGLGAKNLCNDNTVHPIRGQVRRVKADWMYSVFLDESDDGNYIIPNCDSIILGGTHQNDDYNLEINNDDKNFIINGCFQIIPALKNSKLIKDGVGLRPGRSEVRLEKEIFDNGKIVIHNYGHGGSGVTLCWGCASDVLELLKISSKL